MIVSLLRYYNVSVIYFQKLIPPSGRRFHKNQLEKCEKLAKLRQSYIQLSDTTAKRSRQSY